MADSFTIISPKEDEGQEPQGFSIVTPEAMAEEAPPPRTWAETGTGLAKTARSELLRSVPAIAGIPGSVETFAVRDLPTFAKNIGTSVAEKMDYVSPKEAEEIKAKPLPWMRDADVVKEGYAAPFTSLPTFKGIKKGMGEVLKGVGNPESAYEPETGPEKVLAAGIEGAIQSVPGRMSTMPGRAMSGAGAAAAGETAGLATEGQPNEGFWRLASALGGGYAGSKIANAMLPATVGRDQIASALAEDFRKGEGAMTWEQVQSAIKDGTPVSLVDMAGPKTLTILSKMGNMSPSTQTRVGVFNKHLTERSVEAGSRAGETVRDAMGVAKLDADALQQANAASGKTTRDTLWSAVEGSPAADSIGLRDAKLLDSRSFQEAVDRAVGRAADLPDSFNIRPPYMNPGRAGVEDRWEQTPQGFRKVPGQAEIPPETIPGNLPFYHQVDRELGAMITKAYAGGDAQLAAGYKATQNRLRDELDKALVSNGSKSNYRDVVGASRKTFVGEEAPQAGYEFASSIINSRKNPFTRGDVRREFDGMDEANKQNVRLGVAARVQDGVESGQLGHIAKKFATDESFKRDLMHVLGPEAYNRIAGSVMRENIIHQADTLKFLAERVTPAGAGMTAAGVVSAYDVMNAVINGAGSGALSGQLTMKPFLAGLAAMGVKAGVSMAERRVAENTLPLALSKDPKDVARFGEMVSNYPQVMDMYNRLTATMTQAIQNVAGGLDKQDKGGTKIKEDKKAKPGPSIFTKRYGGTVNRQSGGRTGNHEVDADRLISMAESARKQNSMQTEPLVKSDDNVIARALEIANRQYEG
jgi:hypothetical protein